MTIRATQDNSKKAFIISLHKVKLNKAGTKPCTSPFGFHLCSRQQKMPAGRKIEISDHFSFPPAVQC